jgi:hypothetical protein
MMRHWGIEKTSNISCSWNSIRFSFDQLFWLKAFGFIFCLRTNPEQCDSFLSNPYSHINIFWSQPKPSC